MDFASLGITKDEVMSLVVDKIAKSMFDDDSDIIGSIESSISKKISDAVQKAVGEGLETKVDAVLTAEMDKILHEVVTPRTIWGEKNGEPTTIRAALSERARQFWDVRVDDKGSPSNYGGKPRHEHLMRQLLNEEFTAAVKQNVNNIVGAFKDAIKADAARITNEHIDKLIAVKTR